MPIQVYINNISDLFFSFNKLVWKSIGLKLSLNIKYHLMKNDRSNMNISL